MLIRDRSPHCQLFKRLSHMAITTWPGQPSPSEENWPVTPPGSRALHSRFTSDSQLALRGGGNMRWICSLIAQSIIGVRPAFKVWNSKSVLSAKDWTLTTVLAVRFWDPITFLGMTKAKDSLIHEAASSLLRKRKTLSISLPLSPGLCLHHWADGSPGQPVLLPAGLTHNEVSVKVSGKVSFPSSLFTPFSGRSGHRL